MKTLFARRNQVFVSTTAAAATDSVLDLRLRWTTAHKVASLPNPAPNPGETRLISANAQTNNSTPGAITYQFVFTATHPILSGVYYNYTLTGEITPLPRDYVTAGEPYTVVDQFGNHVQYLVSAPTTVAWVTNPYITMLLNLSDGIVYPSPAVVEPFNVLFDYLSDSVDTVQPTISDHYGHNVTIADHNFTNTPFTQTNGVFERAPVAHNFSVVGNSLLLSNRLVQNSTDTWIKSINGLTATEGNISIKVLV